MPTTVLSISAVETRYLFQVLICREQPVIGIGLYGNLDFITNIVKLFGNYTHHMPLNSRAFYCIQYDSLNNLITSLKKTKCLFPSN
jgi:hypothetical protein